MVPEDLRTSAGAAAESQSCCLGEKQPHPVTRRKQATSELMPGDQSRSIAPWASVPLQNQNIPIQNYHNSSLLDQYPITADSVLIDRLVIRIPNIMPKIESDTGTFSAGYNALLERGFQRRQGNIESNYLKFALPPAVGLHSQSRGTCGYSTKQGGIIFLLINQLSLNCMEMLRHHLGVRPGVISLDGNTNFLPADVLEQYTPQDLQAMQMTLLRGTVTSIIEAIQDSFPVYHSWPVPTFQIRQIEVVRDFINSGAISTVRQIGDMLSASGQSCKTVTHAGTIASKTEANCQSYTATNRKGQTLKVYAKTPDLLRIEMEFDGYRLSRKNVLSDRKVDILNSEDVREALSIMTVHFADILSCAQPIESSDHATPATAMSLFWGIHKYTTSPDLAYNIMQLLADSGRLTRKGIAALPGCDPQVLTTLYKKGVLRRLDRGVYGISPTEQRLLSDFLSLLEK